MVAEIEGVVPEGTISETPEPTEEQPLTKEAVAQMVADAKEEAKKEVESHFQSIADRDIRKANLQAAEAQRRAQEVEGTLKLYKGQFAEDPDTVDKLELLEHRQRDAARAQQEAEERSRQAGQAVKQGFDDNMDLLLAGLGIDPKDIDRAEGEQYLGERQKRMHASILKKVGERRKRELEELKHDLLKEQGVFSGDTTVSVGSQSDTDFWNKWGGGELPATSENVRRADKIADKLSKGG